MIKIIFPSDWKWPQISQWFATRARVQFEYWQSENNNPACWVSIV